MAYSDPSIIDRLVRQEFPQPIAKAWAQAQQGSGPSGRIEQARAMLEVFAKSIGALLIADYLRGTPDAGVEKVLARYALPGLGTRWQLVGELCRTRRDS